jgi:hypothetical protein
MRDGTSGRRLEIRSKFGNFQALFEFRKSISKDGREQTVGVHAQTASGNIPTRCIYSRFYYKHPPGIEKHAIPSTRIYPLDTQSVVCFVVLERSIFNKVVTPQSILDPLTDDSRRQAIERSFKWIRLFTADKADAQLLSTVIWRLLGKSQHRA